MEIGNTIKKLRKKKNIQQNELAEKSGISQTYLSQIENGSRSATIDTLEKICLALDIPLPIMSFLSLDINTVNPNKQEAFSRIKPAIQAMIEEFFIQD
jgi:XRE family transcriptional regulator, regulator of sulfur utilization